MAELALDLEAYAALAAELADPSVDRGAALAGRGLDEEGWEALDEAWQERLSQEEAAAGEGVPPLLKVFAEAFAKAQQARAEREISFDTFVEAARELRKGKDATAALARLGLSIEDFMSAHRRWTARMLADEELAARFQRAMSGAPTA